MCLLNPWLTYLDDKTEEAHSSKRFFSFGINDIPEKYEPNNRIFLVMQARKRTFMIYDDNINNIC